MSKTKIKKEQNIKKKREKKKKKYPILKSFDNEILK